MSGMDGGMVADKWQSGRAVARKVGSQRVAVKQTGDEGRGEEGSDER